MRSIKIVLSTVFVFISILLIGQSRDIGNFSAVKVSTSVSAKLVKADAPGLEYKMIKGSADRLITKVEGDRLIVKIKSGFGNWNNAQAKVIIYYTNIDEIDVSAGGSVMSEDVIYADEMDLDASSGASMNIELECARLRGESSSGASMNIMGKAEKADLEASSGSSIRGLRMVCDHVKADVSSGASIEIHAAKSIKAEASSGGSVRYAGEADNSNIDKGWSGEIRRVRG